MANYQLLKADIDEKVYENAQQKITGANLNAVLNAMVTTLGVGYQFAGVATIDTNPGAPDAKVFYIANGKGSYINFGGLEVTEDEMVVLYWDSAWHKVATGIASQAKLSELNQEVNGIVYDAPAIENIFHLTNEISAGDSLIIETDKVYQGGAIQFRNADGGEITHLVFSSNKTQSIIVPSSYYDCVLKWGANFSNLKITRQNRTLKTKVEGENVVVSKNLYNKSVSEAGYIGYDQIVGSSPAYGIVTGAEHSDLIPIIGGASYFISADSVCDGFYKIFLDKDKKVVALESKNGISFRNNENNILLVAPDNAAYLVLTTKFNGVSCVNLQVEIGNSKSAYDDYGETLSIPLNRFPSEAQTVIYNSLKNESKEKDIESIKENLDTLLLGGKYASAGDSITQGTGNANEDVLPNDKFYPLYGTAKKTYAYWIAKSNDMQWYNYGISGSTLGDVVVNGNALNGFTKANGRYTQMANDLSIISIWFGWNDAYYGPIMKREEWLKDTYGSTIYFTSDSSLFGTTANDGNPYCTQEQYDACMAVTGSVGGVEYNTSSEYFSALYVGTPSDTTNKTWCGAFNILLPYLIAKYPLAKILIVTGYGGNWRYWDSAIEMAKKYGVGYIDLSESGSMNFISKRNEESSGIVYYDSSLYKDRTYYKEYASGDVSVSEFRKRTLLYDGTHPNKYGYNYVFRIINEKLRSL